MTERIVVKPLFTLEEIQELLARNKALEIRTQHLELVLKQRIVLTENKYRDNAKHFENLERMVLQVFRDNPAMPFTYADLQVECGIRYPSVPWCNLERRVRQLRAQGALWNDVDPDSHKVRFWLKLEEIKNEK